MQKKCKDRIKKIRERKKAHIQALEKSLTPWDDAFPVILIEYLDGEETSLVADDIEVDVNARDVGEIHDNRDDQVDMEAGIEVHERIKSQGISSLPPKLFFDHFSYRHHSRRGSNSINYYCPKRYPRRYMVWSTRRPC